MAVTELLNEPRQRRSKGVIRTAVVERGVGERTRLSCVLDADSSELSGGTIRFGLEFSEDGGATWRTLMTSEGIKANGVNRRGEPQPPSNWWKGRLPEKALIRAFYESDKARTVGWSVTESEA